MPKYLLPFIETQNGWYEIEANTIEEAKQLADDMDYMVDLEPNYGNGSVTWDSNEIMEDK
jgi:hypothetical protein